MGLNFNFPTAWNRKKKKLISQERKSKDHSTDGRSPTGRELRDRGPMEVTRLEDSRSSWWSYCVDFLVLNFIHLTWLKFFSFFLLLSLLNSAFAHEGQSPLRITEIHYQPGAPYGSQLEFIELKNVSDQKVSLEGWRFRNGIDYQFEAGVELPASGYLVLCKNRDLFLSTFEVDPNSVLGDYEGSLDNGGEKLLLVDAFDAPRESVVYDDKHPWPSTESEEDGAQEGLSIQKLCEDSPVQYFSNWKSDLPTPLQGSPQQVCPSPLPPERTVVFSEIFYNHFEELKGREPGRAVDSFEFVEIHNLTDDSIPLGGWTISGGIQYSFPPNIGLGSQEYLVVCKDPEAFMTRFPDTVNQGILIVGGYEGALSNSGERINLIDRTETLVDTVHYRDSGEWPYASDGEGKSLEKVYLAGIGDDPANWRASQIQPEQSGWVTHVVEGPAGPLISERSSGSVRLTITLDGVGEALIDSLELIDLEEPENGNLVPNSDFTEGITGWAPVGNASESIWVEDQGVDGTGALLLKTTSDCPLSGCWAFEGVTRVISKIKRLGRYRFVARIKPISGSQRISFGFLDGSRIKVSQHTAGLPNSQQSEELLPHVSNLGRFPKFVTSDDPVWITARVRQADDVQLFYTVGEDESVIPMLDDGMNQDGEAGDGIYGAELPPQDDETRVFYRIVASKGDLTEVFPRAMLPSDPRPEEFRGYLVFDTQPDIEFPIYHLLLDKDVDGSSFRSVNSALNCSTLTPTGFVYEGEIYPNVGLRFRGNTACWIDKRNFKLDFNKVRRFQGLKKMNLNGLWTDKALIREHIAWDFIDQIGLHAVETYYNRVYINGSYYGLFLYVEHPDENFLSRVGLDPDGTLYKAKQPANVNADDLAGVNLFSPGTYNFGWEEEANKGSNFQDIETFVDQLHQNGNPEHGSALPTIDFFEENMDIDSLIEFQISQVVLNNIDSAVKNHFLHHNYRTGKWSFILWDQDLILGKFFTRDAVNPGQGRQVGTLNDQMLSDLGWDLNPWIMTEVFGNERYNWLLDLFLRANVNHYQRAYLVRLLSIVEEKYSNEVYNPIIDDLAQRIEAEVQLDFDFWGRYTSNVPDHPQEFLPNVEIAKGQLRKHRDYLLRYFNEFHSNIDLNERVKITELMIFPEEGNKDLEFIELTNFNHDEVSLAGWTLEGIGFEFPEDAMIADLGKVVIARSPEAFIERYNADPNLVFGPYEGGLSNSGEELRLRDAGPGHPATIDYLKYEVQGHWPKIKPGFSIELSNASAFKDNDLGTSWVHSSKSGGTPLEIPAKFIRGDVNLDEKADMTDAITILGFLFLGEGFEISCMDSADLDDTGVVNITDPIYLLSYLFLGTDAPKAPFPAPGFDPTDDDSLPCPPNFSG